MMNGRRLQFGVAVIDDKLFVIGGRDGLKTLNSVECYNPKTKTWTVLPPMSTHRHGLGKILTLLILFLENILLIVKVYAKIYYYCHQLSLTLGKLWAYLEHIYVFNS